MTIDTMVLLTGILTYGVVQLMSLQFAGKFLYKLMNITERYLDFVTGKTNYENDGKKSE